MRHSAAILASLLFLVAAFAAALLVGSGHLSLAAALAGKSPDREIMVGLRLPRAVLALWTGGALALSGVLLQALLRNPLAEPYTLGVSGGASLGAVLAIFFRLDLIAGFSAISFLACLGSGVILLLLLALSSQQRSMSATRLLLAGVTLNSICGAAIFFLASLSDLQQTFSLSRWLMGGLNAPSYPVLGWLTIVLLPVCTVAFLLSRDWNLLSVGETWAATRGLSPHRLFLMGSVAASLLTGVVTALTGPIGFVGLIVPHALRLWLGADHRVILPCSFLTGAAFLALCDVFSRTLLAPVEIPVGVITALLGGPVFIWMLRGGRRSFLA